MDCQYIDFLQRFHEPTTQNWQNSLQNAIGPNNYRSALTQYQIQTQWDWWSRVEYSETTFPAHQSTDIAVTKERLLTGAIRCGNSMQCTAIAASFQDPSVTMTHHNWVHDTSYKYYITRNNIEVVLAALVTLLLIFDIWHLIYGLRTTFTNCNLCSITRHAVMWHTDWQAEYFMQLWVWGTGHWCSVCWCAQHTAGTHTDHT